MFASLHPLDIAWEVTSAIESVLLAGLLWRRTFLRYPVFTVYIVSTLLQSAAIAYLYQQSGLSRASTWAVAWGSQGVVSLMRALAIAELTRSLLERYPGIWKMARRILLWVGGSVLGYALLFSKDGYQWAIMNGVRGLELAMAAVIVTVLLFARYYRLPIHPLQRALAIGLCLYSAFYVIDYSLLERVLQQYAEFWNFLGITTFLASLLVWLWGVIRSASFEEIEKPIAIPPEAYRKLSAKVNLRLHLLNRQLTELQRAKDKQP